jgi:hypothetical protein
MATVGQVGPTGTNLIYDTAALVGVVPNLKVAQSFLLDRFFPTMITSETEFVAIDVDVGKRRIAPFVSPLSEGKLVEARRIQTNVFKPAYVKDKRAPDLRRPVRRMIGERIGGTMDPGDRAMANLAFEMADQLDMLTRRLEWMAAQALLTGTVTIAGEGFPTVLIDFGRNALNTVALTGSAQWTVPNVIAGTASPTGNIEAWQRNVLKQSGAIMKDIIFTTSSWAGFIADPVLKGVTLWPALNSQFGSAINIGAQIGRGAIYKGRWGSYDLWLFNDWYVDMGTEITAPATTDTQTLDKEYPMLPDGTVILSGPDMMGIRAFGTILDPAFNYASMPFAPKTWTSNDPAQQYLMMQCSPIVIPARVNAAMGITACPAVYT